jgi:peptidoglycan hydrolase CwlO-like protein
MIFFADLCESTQSAVAGLTADERTAHKQNLNAEIAALKGRVASLERDNDLLTDRCESAQRAVASLTADERTARLAFEDRQKLNHLRLRAEYDTVKSLFFSIIFICLNEEITWFNTLLFLSFLFL